MLHDIYVKLVQLHYNEVNIAEDVVLLDEAQDINPVFADIFSKTTGQIAVDSNQAIYQLARSIFFLKCSRSAFTRTNLSLLQRLLTKQTCYFSIWLSLTKMLKKKILQQFLAEPTWLSDEAVACIKSEVPFRQG